MSSDRQKQQNPVVLIVYNYLYTGDNMFGYLQADDKFMLDDRTFVTLTDLHKGGYKFKLITRHMLREVFDRTYIEKKRAHKIRLEKEL